MPFDETHIRTAKQQAQDRADAASKHLVIDQYREPLLAAIPPCPMCGEPMQWELLKGERAYACYARACPESAEARRGTPASPKWETSPPSSRPA